MKTSLIAFKFFVFVTVLTGFGYPAFMTLFSQAVFTTKANGSLILNRTGQAVGSELIAQNFKASGYFWPRPSAIDYNPMPSGGSNLGPISADLSAKVKERQAHGMTDDLLFASGSGLDPHISPKAAMGQIARVAIDRHVPEDKVRSIVIRFIENRQLGIFGEPRVNVLRLNLALDER